ncbi:MAG TPA: DUF1801 domain-containing protein [Bacteroidia bacterium]|jgi:hypothetical protein
MDPKVQQFLAALPEDKRKLIMLVRDIVLSSNKEVTEAIKWKQLTFVSGKTNLAFVYSYSGLDYVNLGFMQATSLSDPKQLFEGTGKGMRHIKIRTEKDIPAAQIKKWVKEAVSLKKA